MASSVSDENIPNPHRKLMCIAIGSICQSLGFTGINRDALQTLAEMLQSFIIEIGRTSTSFSEHSGRTQPGIGDVVMALIDLGINVESVGAYLKQHGNAPSMSCGLQPASQSLKLLQAGEKKSHPNYIPDHFPNFPDPHTYIQTSTHKQPVTEYEAIREKAASQKKDVERALTRFIAKTGNTDSLFMDESASNLFPLIATNPEPIPYLGALIPKDQVFEEEEPVVEKKPKRSERKKAEEDEVVFLESEESSKVDTSENEIIDNPYLRPCKVLRKMKK